MKQYIQRIITGTILGTCFWLALVYAPPIIFSCLLLIILITIITLEWKNLFTLSSPSFWCLMPFYPILPFILLIFLNHHPFYRPLLFMLFVIVSSYDTGGYIVGSFIGTHKMAPSISPGKSWEGFFGGYLFACIGLLLLLYELNIQQSWITIFCFTMIVCIISCLGDFFESWLKRRAGVKNSGSSLPGHGGFLDRFDGILCAVFFFYFFRDTLILLFNL